MTGWEMNAPLFPWQQSCLEGLRAVSQRHMVRGERIECYYCHVVLCCFWIVNSKGKAGSLPLGSQKRVSSGGHQAAAFWCNGSQSNGTCSYKKNALSPKWWPGIILPPSLLRISDQLLECLCLNKYSGLQLEWKDHAFADKGSTFQPRHL